MKLGSLFESQIKALNSIGTVTINFSQVTNRWYINVQGLGIKDGILLHGVCEHRNTIEDATNAFCKALVGRNVIKDVGTERKHFVLVPVQCNEQDHINIRGD